MWRAIKIVFLILALYNLVIGQTNVSITDTIKVVTLEKFNVPQNKTIVLTNILDIKFNAELLDSNFSKIRDCSDEWQEPAASEFPVRGKRGKMVQYLVKETIEEAGVYFVRVNISYQDEETRNSVTVYYRLEVGYPSIAASIDLRERYFFSEQETFSFTTIEFSDVKGYSYVITDNAGTVVDSGNGSVVNLQKVLNEDNNVGKTLRISGNYKGREFKFKSSDDSQIKDSYWEITVDKPELDQFVAWNKEGDEGARIISIYNDKAMKFLYLYVGRTPNGFAVVAPKVRNLNVVSDPRDFIQNFRSQTSGKFLYIDAIVNPDFLQKMEECGEEYVELRITFTTQFGEKADYKYYATVIK